MNAIIDATPGATAPRRVSLDLGVSRFSTIVLAGEQVPVIGRIFEMLTFTSFPQLAVAGCVPPTAFCLLTRIG